MTILRGRNFLMTPGPTNIPDRILTAMHRPAVDLYSDSFIDLCKSCIEDLPSLFGTESDVFIFPSNGHGAWEGALANPLPPGARVLIPETGFFATTWSRAADGLGLTSTIIESDGRSPVSTDLIGDYLEKDVAQNIDAILLVHVDTASGLQSDVVAIRRILDNLKHPALLIVDAVASLGGSEFKMDEWGVDVTVAASQKALMLPPGFGFNAVNEKAMKRRRQNDRELYYWDWERRQSSQWYDWFCGSAPEHLIFGLREALDMVLEEGMDLVVNRHYRLSRAVLAAVEVWSKGGAMERNVKLEKDCSNTVTAVLLDEKYDPIELVRYLSQTLNVSFGGGLGGLIGKAFRIAHMGDINEPMILGALGCVEHALRVKQIPHGAGGVEAAIASLSIVK